MCVLPEITPSRAPAFAKATAGKPRPDYGFLISTVALPTTSPLGLRGSCRSAAPGSRALFASFVVVVIAVSSCSSQEAFDVLVNDAATGHESGTATTATMNTTTLGRAFE